MTEILFTEPPKSVETLSREEVVRQTLEFAAGKIEARAGNDVYRKAWKVAGDVLRAIKPEEVNRHLAEVNRQR